MKYLYRNTFLFLVLFICIFLTACALDIGHCNESVSPATATATSSSITVSTTNILPDTSTGSTAYTIPTVFPCTTPAVTDAAFTAPAISTTDYHFTPFVQPKAKWYLDDLTPDLSFFDENYRIRNFLQDSPIEYPWTMRHFYEDKLVTETDYSNIELALSCDSVPPTFQAIGWSVVNHNPGKAFWVWTQAFLEHFVDGVWVRLPWYNRAIFNTGQMWRLVGFSERTITAAMYDSVDPTEIPAYKGAISGYEPSGKQRDPLTPGQYRVAVYVGKEILYAPLTIVEE